MHRLNCRIKINKENRKEKKNEKDTIPLSLENYTHFYSFQKS